jgi:hypothetical protein
VRRTPWWTAARGTAVQVGRIALAALAAALLAAGGSAAQDASGYAELRASRNDAEGEDSLGNRREQRDDLFEQRYNLDVAWRLYPNMTVRLGGLFERDDVTSESGGMTTDATARTFRPYLTAILRSAIYSAQFGYYLIENDVDSGGVSIGNNQEVWNGTIGWRPERAPSAVIRWIRTENFDDGRRFIDTQNDLLDLTSEYAPFEELNFYYRGARNETEDRLQDTTSDRTSNAVRVNYGDAWWDRRLQVNGEYVFNDVTTDVTTSGTGEIESPLFPIAGLASLDDIPINDPLLPNPLLIDGDQLTPAGVDLVYDPATEPIPLGRNLGLDFGGAATVNTLSVWIDNDLSADPGIENTFVWEIYSSSDNLIWALEQPPSMVTFGPFLNRFEIRFPNVTSRYLKVVTSPINTQFINTPAILVTELSAARRTPAADVVGETSRRTELLTTSVRAEILEVPELYYEFSSFFRQFDGSPTLYTISNGLSLRHAFTPEYSVSGRVAREDSRESIGDLDSLIYSASFRAAPLDTLQSNLVFSGRSTDFEGRSTDDQSVFLYTTADLYRGITANLGLGVSENVAGNGEKSDNTIINALATLVPHQTTTLNLLYQRRRNARSGGNLAAPFTETLDQSQASVSYRPVSTLYFFFSYRLEELRDGSDRFLRNYAASWSPFPGGALQVLFNFDESYNSEFEALSRISSPRVRWNISNRWWLDLAYERSKFDSIFELREAKIWTATTRFTF